MCVYVWPTLTGGEGSPIREEERETEREGRGDIYVFVYVCVRRREVKDKIFCMCKHFHVQA